MAYPRCKITNDAVLAILVRARLAGREWLTVKDDLVPLVKAEFPNESNWYGRANDCVNNLRGNGYVTIRRGEGRSRKIQAHFPGDGQ